jgi:3',5'-cyclic AMP phosphodiesterase CpdA
MGTLLHLSDLHLASAKADTDVLGDYKTSIVLPEERQRRTGAISDTLNQLGSALSAAGFKLDAIVITGDVTFQGRQDGIDLLPDVLAQLGDALPPNDRILIVPGNHDVVWGTEPSSPERYERFITLRKKGYRIAYLDGVDATSDGVKPATPPLPEPCVVAADYSFAVVGINSCDMCGVELDVEPDVKASIKEIEALAAKAGREGIAVQNLQKAWKQRGLYDVARVSKVQRKICSELAQSTRADIHDEGQAAPVMIAAFHHQLRPVSGAEEFKPFEGITNQGEVREWLAGNQFDLLLHGHKHEERVLEDIFVPFSEGHHAASHRLLVISAPTIGHGQPASNPVGRLITVNAQMPRIADITLTLIPARSTGVPIVLDSLRAEAFTVGNDDGARLGVLEGATAEDVYNKILAAGRRLHSLPRPLVCRFDDGPSARRLPPNYPDVGFASEGETEEARRTKMQQWFEETVDWWQRPIRGEAASFNHGERIRGHDGSDPSQFESAITSLRSNSSTSRAVMVLINPANDFDEPNSSFPAFALVQMLVQDGALTMTGYFRKQEMPHWWPINVGELATLQQNVIEVLRPWGINLMAGSICTITALPVSGSSAPRVVIPDIDRRVETPARFLDLLVPLYFGGASASVMITRWSEVIDDWRPTDQIAADGDPVPVLGFSRLIDLAAACNGLSAGRVADPKPGERLVTQLKQLRDVNARYADGQNRADRVEQHRQWRNAVDALINDILATVAEMAQAGTAK